MVIFLFVQEFYIVHNLMLGLKGRLIRIVDVVIFWRGEVQNTKTELAKKLLLILHDVRQN